MSVVRLALANLPLPSSADESVSSARRAIADAGKAGAQLVCFPECFVPGYRTARSTLPPPDPAFLDRAWKSIADAAADAKIAVVLGTERVVNGDARITTLVFDHTGKSLGFQDKVQLDPSEEGLFTPGAGRSVFEVGPLTFGISICHEGWRYPETFRWAVRRGAQLVVHPHFHEAEPGGYRPTSFADPANTFHEKAMLCRAAENTCFVATVNCASEGSPTTSAFVRPDGTLLSFQPYGKPGLLVADIELSEATGLLASRLKSELP